MISQNVKINISIKENITHSFTVIDLEVFGNLLHDILHMADGILVGII